MEHSAPLTEETPYGLMAEFKSPEDLIAAAHKVYGEGYRKIDAFTPFPVEGLAQAIGFQRTWVPFLVLVGGLLGALAGFVFQYWASALYYPHNIGGRPFFSWPAFIPITFELTVLFASFGAVAGMIVLNGLPRLYHPVFNSARFAAHASSDGFFLCVETADTKYDPRATQSLLESLGAKHVETVSE